MIKNLKKQVVPMLIFFVVMVAILPIATFAATTPSLGAAATYGVLSSTYTNTTVTTINGDVGFTTPPAVAPLGAHPYYGSVPPYSTAGTDQNTALAALNGQACDFSFGVATDLSTLPQPLVAGVYCITAAASIGTSGITLSGAGTYIFRITGTLNTVANSEIILTGGASACDVFWTPVGATTLAANTIFKGTVIDDAGITVGANTTWAGRALAFGETVTTDTTTITNTCLVATPATLHVIKLVDNTSGGTAIASVFAIHVLLSGSDVAGSPGSGTAISGTTYALYPGTYLVSEDVHASYSTSFTGDCTSTGSVTLSAGNDKTCTIINRYIPLGNGGGLGSSISIDNCPDGDDSISNYDGKCTPTPSTSSTATIIPPPVVSPTPPLVVVSTSSIPVLPTAATPIKLSPTASSITLPNKLPNSGASAVEERGMLASIALVVSMLVICVGLGVTLRSLYRLV